MCRSNASLAVLFHFAFLATTLALVQSPAAQQHDEAAMRFASQTWDATFFFPGGTYDARVPAPETVLGFPVGSRPARYDEVRRYFEALAATSERVVLLPHGRTHENRELFHLGVGLPARMAPAARDDLRARLARFADPRSGGGDVPASDLPLVAWLGYSIHGDELSGCDAALQLGYQLAAGTDVVTRGILDSVLVFIDPMENPDGRERYLAQMLALNGRVPNPDDQSLQHRGFWPWGRGNHYLFDLNRDWFTLVHPESRGRIEQLTTWWPHLVVDVHEMGWDDTYLFSPPREPFNPNLPAAVRRWWDVFAADQAQAFGKRGWSHYTREWNEEFFPGYGSSWAMYHGAIGILYEQAGTDGSVVRQTDGSYLSYREAVQHQFESSLANLRTAAQHRDGILRDYRSGRRAAVEQGRRGPLRSFVVVPGVQPERAAQLAATLLRQGIEVQRATGSLVLSAAHDIWSGEPHRLEVPAGSYVIQLDQPAAPLVRNLLDFHVAMPDSFLREERDWLERDKGTRLYDVTAWSFALAYGLKTYWTSTLPRGQLTLLEGESGPAPGGARHAPAGPLPSYGYVIDGESDAAMQGVARLLEGGFSVRVALDAFALGGRSFPRGSAVLRVRTNPAALHDSIWTAGVPVFPTGSGRADSGPDLGGNRFPALAPPRIALVAGNPVSFVSYGSLWHLLDHDLGVRVASLDVAAVGGLDLSKYNVLVLPDAFGDGSTYARALGPRGVENLAAWVKAGGTLVALGAGAAFAADSTRGLSAVRPRAEVRKEHPPALAKLALPESPRMDALGDAPRPPLVAAMPLLGAGARSFVQQVRPRGVRYDFESQRAKPATSADDTKEKPTPRDLERADARLRRFVPQGAFLRADVEPEHWLTVGVPARLPVLARDDPAFIARHPVRVLARFAAADSLHLSGLLWPEAADRLARTAYVTQEASGKGQVILFAGDPTYRRATPAGERLLWNALFLAPGLGVSRSAPW